MAGLETIVRPVVLPNIRPPQARSLAPEDDPERGVCVLNGSSGRLIDLSISENSSISRSRSVELKRRFDEVRIYHKDDDGTVDRDQFVDVQVAKKMWLTEGDGTVRKNSYKRIEETDNIEIIRKDMIATTEFFGSPINNLFTHEDFK